ncbi:hypothetical protein KFL_000060580 [Klebsormidium nitens]|uniref:Uncharacterized protein n=1 Tax=Klebsormidium nitens TaxID=105231 RepID=A0A0U9HM17_KLENI|nr:hypothetical protein KFL_000060580 [Klebsormidium nitens]|eukprot:GAQ77992.1 hypothetical protein KFL_000060580 [Klebsormidium nitens]
MLNLRLSRQQATELELSLCLQIGVEDGLVSLRSRRQRLRERLKATQPILETSAAGKLEERENNDLHTNQHDVSSGQDPSPASEVPDNLLHDLTARMDHIFCEKKLLGAGS